MNAVLLRTVSIPGQPSFVLGSPRFSLSVHDSVAAVLSNNKNYVVRSIRRALSESDMIRSGSEFSGGFSWPSGVGSWSFPARIREEEHLAEVEEGVGVVGSLFLDERGFDRSCAGDRPESIISVEELGFFGGGVGKGSKIGGGGDDDGTGAFTGGSSDRSKLGAYYREMLKSNPMNSLLLRNYGKFLQEVEKNTLKAEEYYGRAILASPGDGEVLSLYGKLIWETQRDENRAKSYFDQAVHASPDDCMVLGSYAHFMWEAEEDEEL